MPISGGTASPDCIARPGSRARLRTDVGRSLRRPGLLHDVGQMLLFSRRSADHGAGAARLAVGRRDAPPISSDSASASITPISAARCCARGSCRNDCARPLRFTIILAADLETETARARSCSSPISVWAAVTVSSAVIARMRCRQRAVARASGLSRLPDLAAYLDANRKRADGFVRRPRSLM